MRSTISIGKYGSFQANHIIGRPYHLTFEILDEVDTVTQSSLRLVPAAELYTRIVSQENFSLNETQNGTTAISENGVEYEVVGQDGKVVLRTNRNIIDDSATQTMTMDEIEALKNEGTGSGKDLIAKILESHSALDQKTAFALAKYTLRKTKKYMKRFTVLPLDALTLAQWIMSEKEPMKILEIRTEILALIVSWANIHYAAPDQTLQGVSGLNIAGHGRWLMLDETGGLLVAAVAERLGLMNSQEEDMEDSELVDALPTQPQGNKSKENGFWETDLDGESPTNCTQLPVADLKSTALACTNTITLLHANAQPNLSLLKYFNFDASNPARWHPLQDHLKTISWLQLLAPEEDIGYAEPESVTFEELKGWKSGKRGNYHRKRRRWGRIKSVVDETRNGGFDGLIIASTMNLTAVLNHTVPLLRGAAQVVIYSPTIEPLSEISDYYSTGRKTAFMTQPYSINPLPTEDFPLNPTLLLAPTIQTARARSWQVLPGRTHPIMTGRGGAEGYILTATRVLPAEGKIEARGNIKRRKPNSSSVGEAEVPVEQAKSIKVTE